MKISGNTVLITGGGSGIGLALAERLISLQNEVIVAGRTHSKLATAKALGCKTLEVDLNNEQSLQAFTTHLLAEYPKLNVVILNAGVMMNEKYAAGRDNSATVKQTISTNILAPILLTNSLLTHLLQQKSAALITVTSGLAFVPLALTPTYSASKAAIHAFTESLRIQLAGTSVEVKELIPPYTRTALMGDRQAKDNNAMPLNEYIDEVIGILTNQPNESEIAVGRVQPQRTAAFSGKEHYENFLKTQNDRLMAARKTEWDAL